jgi:hypothetical protein
MRDCEESNPAFGWGIREKIRLSLTAHGSGIRRIVYNPARGVLFNESRLAMIGHAALTYGRRSHRADEFHGLIPVKGTPNDRVGSFEAEI